ncbi:TPA: hypothetical protein ACQT1A_003474 [Pseudomonas aeruginosa]|uniref:hypothetical protein n=1 Tax=Pseudomonas aeruginosa group TaxID=136841 RepID=UPI001092EF84|nr:hypothetical protein [Pseudomonas aeruginosa]MBA5191048.1 hypothetical protein [Pseudomonas aeruginosa]MBG7009580.1 hypothetical protein [Pseudomonas aeruginosa]MBG7027443.1 hypothetical protein [Pseudomonas aeruginosa]MBG7370038.1 hypothetical protein [Pseudomonas aeruginosa]MBH4346026.1 hypothetical protein [Pseudomonas aeruginosa]
MSKPKAVWGHDEDGDLTLRVGEKLFTFYKWHEALERKASDVQFTPLNDSSSKTYWRRSIRAD